MSVRAVAEADYLSTRSAVLYDKHLDEVHEQTNRVFFWLLLAQWIFAILVAIVWSPFGWEGKIRSTNVHVPAAFLIGALINSLPLALIKLRPRAAYTRHVVTSAQMLWSALLIHLTGGRIETHFHVFGSLAFVAFYRDWKLFPTATLVVASDHLVRGYLWPESVYGVASTQTWRFIEHASWVAFEDVVLVLACIRATTEMRQIARSRAEIEAQQGALVRSEKLAAIGELAASVGHELRNPLTAVKGAMSYLAKRINIVRPNESVEADPKVKEFIELMDRELTTCNRIISELLDFAKDRPPQLSPCPLRSLVADSFALVPGRSGVTLVNSVPENLPVPNLDKEQFRRILVNLVQNASEAFGDMGGRVEVTATGGASGWSIEVHDDGPGMPPDVLGRIFQPLFTTKTRGTGLGLAIVANMVERHNGTIDVKSEIGHGTHFIVRIPGNELRQAAA
jgi:two-component system, NtrC family, sensor histidine kinase HydH